MLDIESMISAQRVMAFKKYCAGGHSSQKTILDEFVFNVYKNSFSFVTSTLVNSQLIFQLSIKSVSIQMSFCMRMSSTKSFEIANLSLLTKNRFSKNICFVRELLKIGDLFSNTGKVLKVLPTRYFKLISVLDVIPIVGRFILKHELQTNEHFYSSFLGDKVYIEYIE